MEGSTVSVPPCASWGSPRRSVRDVSAGWESATVARFVPGKRDGPAGLFGLRLTGLIYMGLSEALNQVFGQDAVNIALYMPDTVMNEDPLETVKAIVVAVVTGAIFLPLAIRIFDRKDVK